MKIIIDTHLFFWSVFEPEKLNEVERAAISDTHNTIFLSVASLWELSIKKSIGKIDFPDALMTEVEKSGFSLLGINLDHIKLSGRLPLIHKDPFDRMIISQTMTEKLSLLTRDKVIKSYFDK